MDFWCQLSNSRFSEEFSTLGHGLQKAKCNGQNKAGPSFADATMWNSSKQENFQAIHWPGSNWRCGLWGHPSLQGWWVRLQSSHVSRLKVFMLRFLKIGLKLSVFDRVTDGETGHRLAVWSLSKGIHPACRQQNDPALQVDCSTCGHSGVLDDVPQEARQPVFENWMQIDADWYWMKKHLSFQQVQAQNLHKYL